MLPRMGHEGAEHAVRCVRYTRWIAACLMVAFAYVAWQAIEGLIDWDAEGADFPWPLLVGSVVLLTLSGLMGSAAQFAHHELVRLIRSERKLLRLDPDVDLLAD
jgi:hypothetical protein